MFDLSRIHVRTLLLVGVLATLTTTAGCQASSGTPGGRESGRGDTDADASATLVSVADYSDYCIAASPLAAGASGEWSFTIDTGEETIPSELRIVWDFGDGNAVEGMDQMFVFQSAGTHVVAATAYEADGSVVFELMLEVEVVLPADVEVSALAGADRTVTEGEFICLEGGAEPSRDSQTYRWRQIEGPTVALQSAAVPGHACFEAPQVSETVRLQFELTVQDGQQLSTDQVSIVVRSNPELSAILTADAGEDQIVTSGDVVLLTGSGRGGVVGEPLDFHWSQLAGPGVSLASVTREVATFIAPVVTGEAQTLRFRLTIAQGDARVSDEVDVTVHSGDAGGGGGGGGGGAGCLEDAECDDGLYCNGAEQCVGGACEPGVAPCPGQQCDEVTDACVDCLSDADCDDGQFCNGPEVCLDGTCQSGGDPFLPAVAAGQVLRADVVEASGLAAGRRNPGVLWTHDDSGGANVVFAINTTGQLLGTYQLGSGSLTDAEDIAVGPGPTPGVNYIYVGDIGDNSSSRSSIRIKRVPEPAVDVDQAPTYVTLSDVEIITLVYPSGADAPAHKDSEAMFVDTNGDIYLVTKRIYPNKVYRASFPQSTSSTVILEYVATLPTGPGLAWITGADCSADGRWIVVTNDQTTDYANIWQREPGTPLGEAVTSSPCPLLLQAEPQGEAIAWDALGLGFYTLSEAHNESEPLWYYERNANAD